MSAATFALTTRPRRSLLRALALLFASLALLAVPAGTAAQSILQQQPLTKEDARAAAESESSSAGSDSSGSDTTMLYWLVGFGGVLIAGAAWWMLRDAGDMVGDERRAAPGRPLPSDAVGRGAPKTMFTGDGEPGGKVGKRRKRVQGKRQRQARKANRPR